MLAAVTTTVRPLLAILPALNEEETVGSVVARVRAELGIDVLVVDDGSTDRTAEVARLAGAKVVRHPFNLGVGAALRTGFRFAVASGYFAAVQIDADGQHDPSSALLLLQPILDGEADLVVGSRFSSGYEVGFLRGRGMKMLARLVSRRIGVQLTDTTSGFRAFSRGTLDMFARRYPSQYLSDTVEALLMAGAEGLTIVEKPAQMHDRQGGSPSAGSFKSAYHFVRLLLVIVMSPIRQPLPSEATR